MGSREYNTEVASSCAFSVEVETFKDCMANRPGGETASVRSSAYTSTDDTSFVKSMIDRSYDEGWRPRMTPRTSAPTTTFANSLRCTTSKYVISMSCCTDFMYTRRAALVLHYF